MEFPYSYHKKMIEERLAFYRKKYPFMKQFIFRVSTILGENTKIQITNFFKKKYLLGIKGSHSPFCFVWDQDVINCLEKAIFVHPSKSGIYNLSGDGFLTIEEIGKFIHKKIIYLNADFLKIFLKFLNKIKLTNYTLDQVLFLQYRPVLDNQKLKKKFNYIP